MSKEHAYAYEAGYRDGSINYELEHCPACKNVADLQEALAENAKLRETLHRRTEQFEGMTEMWVERGVENAKLRELVRDMWEGYNDPRCEECHLKDTPTCADCPICAREASVIDRMRELGVEVDA